MALHFVCGYYNTTYIFFWPPWPEIDGGPISIPAPDLWGDDIVLWHVERLGGWGRRAHKLLSAGDTLHFDRPGDKVHSDLLEM